MALLMLLLIWLLLLGASKVAQVQEVLMMQIQTGGRRGQLLLLLRELESGLKLILGRTLELLIAVGLLMLLLLLLWELPEAVLLLRLLLVMQMRVLRMGAMLGAVGNGQLHARLDKVLLIVLLQI